MPWAATFVITVSGSPARSFDPETPQATPLTNTDAQSSVPIEPNTSGNRVPANQPTPNSVQPSVMQRFPGLEKLTSQSAKFSDVSSRDWAYESISTLMQKYGCISGYPDGTFRGQQSLTRSEFAAGMESCMSRMDKIIQERTANLVTREDLATLFRILSTIFDNAPAAPPTAPKLPSTAPPTSLPAPNGSP